jgi:PAS domain S-box-containing protein
VADGFAKPMTTSSDSHLPDHVLQMSPPADAAPLEEAFADSFVLFNETTRRYMEAYKQLEEQFEYLNVKLEETNRELRISLEEKDRVSNYLNNILESISGGVLVTDLDGNITVFNRAAEAITGRSQEDVLGKSYEDVIGLDAGRDNTVLHTLESGHGMQSKEKDLLRADGRTIPLGFSTSLVHDNDGHILGAAEVFNDLTEMKRLEEQVRRMHTLAALGEMAATVAHEIRNPLGGIASFANLLERDLATDDPSRRLVRKITEGVARLNRIVSSLLSYTRPLKLNTHSVDLLQTVEEAAAFFEIDLERKQQAVEIRRLFPDPPCICPVDTEQFHQVVLNLLLNATQAMPEGGTIDLEVTQMSDTDGDWVLVHVRDTGIGIDEELLQKLFTPFVTTKEDGTGLGLVTSRKIIEAHGGSISVESSPGDGTCFSIALPL